MPFTHNRSKGELAVSIETSASSAAIATAIASFHFNERVLDKVLPSITPEDALRRPSGHSNHALWVLGHVLYCRNSVIKILGQPPALSQPWLPLFNRGSKVLEDPSAYPAWNELLEVRLALTPQLHKALSEAPEELLEAPAPDKGAPSFDGKISGIISFFAYHETYHGGQLGYLVKWLGHEGPVG
jgi:uncharacterized damage-inducible protein DinB